MPNNVTFSDPVPPVIFTSKGEFESLRDRRPVNVTIGSDVSIVSGTPLTVRCPVRGVPMPKIVWAKGKTVVESGSRIGMDCNGTLTIYQARLEDSGEYVCTADNYAGMDMAFTTVTVYGALNNPSTYLHTQGERGVDWGWGREDDWGRGVAFRIVC